MRMSRRLAIFGLGLLVLVAAASGAAHAYLQSESGRRDLARRLARLVSEPGVAELRIGELKPGLPGRVRVSGLQVGDRAGMWLRVDQAELVWSPLALFRGRLQVDRVQVSQVHLDRLPDAAATDAGEGEETAEPTLSLPRLPLDLRVDRVAVEGFRLGAAVIGDPAVANIEGKLHYPRHDKVVAELAIARADDRGGGLKIAGEFEPRTHALSLEIAAWEPQGGVILRLLGLDPYPALSVQMEASGSLAAWRGRLAAEADGLFDVAGELAVDRTDALRGELKGRAEVAAVVAGIAGPALRPLVEGGVAFAVHAVSPETSRVVVDSLELRSAALSVNGSGHVHLPSRTVDATVGLAVLQPELLQALVDPLAFASADAEVRIRGGLARPEIVARATLREASLPGMASGATELSGRLQWDAPSTQESAPIRVEAAVEGRALRVDDPMLEALVGEALAASIAGVAAADGSTMALERVRLSAAGIEITGNGALDFSGGESELAVTGRVDELARLSSGLPIELAGRALMQVSARGDLRDGSASGTLSARTAELAVADPLLDRVLGPELTVAADYSIAAQALEIRNLMVRGFAFSAGGQARLTDGMEQIDAVVELAADDLAVVGEALEIPLAGVVSGTASISGTVADPALTLTAAVAAGDVAEVAVPSAHLQVRAVNLGTRPSGQLRLQATTSLAPIDAAAGFRLSEGDRLRLDRVDIRSAGLRVDGELDVPLAAGSLTGRLEANLRAEDEAMVVAGVRLGGRADLDLRLFEEKGEPAASMRLKGSSLAIGVGGEPLLLRSLSGEVSGRLSDAAFRLRLESGGKPDGEMEARGRIAAGKDGARVSVDALSATIARTPVRLLRPARFQLDPGRFAMSELRFRVGDASHVALAGETGQRGTSGRLSAKRLPLALAALPATELPLAGSIDADVVVESQGQWLAGRLDLRVNDLALAERQKATVPPLQGELAAAWSGRVVQAEGRLRGLGGEDLTLAGRLPLAVDARTLAVRPESGAPISATLRWAGELASLFEALPLPDHRLSGRGRVALDVSGTVAAPRVDGEAQVTGGRYEHLTYGTLLEGLDGGAVLGPGGVATVRMSASDGGDGEVSAEGRVAILGEAPAIELDLRFRNATLVRRDDVTATADGGIRYAERGASQRLEGRVETRGVEIRLVKSLPPSVVYLQVTEVGRDGRIVRPPPPEETSGKSIEADLTLDFPGRVFVRGRGLESEWKGSLRIRGPVEAPRIDGTLEVVRGDFTFAGKRFVLHRGRIDFDGSPEVDPRLAVDAEYAGSDITGIVSISGRASRPEITLSSRPSLPQSEILPRVLFGKRSSQLGPAEALQIALALDTLRGGSGVGENLLGASRNLLGVDILTLEPGEGDEGSAVRIGRYIGDRLYIETRQGTKPGTSRYRAEVEVIEDIAVEGEFGETGQGAQGSVGLRWEFDY
jgi:translocation and assembly module TamB